MNYQFINERMPGSRALGWFSCGAASAVAMKLMLRRYAHIIPCEVCYCNTLKYEHKDNWRFIQDIERWLRVEIKVLSNPKYKDIYDVFDKEKFLVGMRGAKCTEKLKRDVGKMYRRDGDINVFGYTLEENNRARDFMLLNPEIVCDWVLQDCEVTKQDCFNIIRSAGIKLPAMYQLGYRNNNCIGCVKGGMGYWNKIRRDFPKAFAKMAKQERKMGVAICKIFRHGQRFSIFLDELDPRAGEAEAEPDIECGPHCALPPPFEERLDGKLAT